ncbi:MAG: response regulator [Litoreibacter sp.]|nr:response regulator [Litoreibacter sp.]
MTDAPAILLVDDNDLDVEILTRALAKADINNPVIRAVDGIDALQILKDHAANPHLPEPFVVLLDINMPRMNGLEFLSAMRNDPTLASRQVFVFSTSGHQADIASAYAEHASGYFVKPNKTSDLVLLLKALKGFWDQCRYTTSNYSAQ